jgi:peptidoglycan/LPS O-acetylase OafA/YrhL
MEPRISKARAQGVETTDGRYAALDGLRGLAAASVVILHFSQIFTDTALPEYRAFDRCFSMLSRTPIAILWSGTSAVVLFFVLSGFVLYRMMTSSGSALQSYVVRRITRLWIPCAVTVTVAALGLYLVPGRPIVGQSAWLNSLINVQPLPGAFSQHLLMLGDFDTKQLDPVIWSLVLELRLSLIFPLIYWAVRRMPAAPLLGLSTVIGMGAAYLQNRSHGSSVSLYATFVCQWYFVAGALVAKQEAVVRQWYRKLPSRSSAIAGAAAVALYCNLVPFSTTLSVMAGASWIFIAALCSQPLQRMLLSSAAQWLGRVSYSLYLSHLVVLLFLVRALHAMIPLTSVACIAAPLAIGVAIVLWRYVEEPAIRWSRQLGRRLALSATRGIQPAKMIKAGSEDRRSTSPDPVRARKRPTAR